MNAPTDPLIGQVIAERYRIEAVVGAGGWGTVYKGRHLTLNRSVAVKLLHPHLMRGDESLTRFSREAEAGSRLNHPSIVTIHDYGSLAGGRPYMVLEFLSGLSLSDKLASDGAMDWKAAMPLFIQCCDALSYAHRKGVLHRDLKPGNIFLAMEDGATRIKILDFGLAKLVAPEDVAEASLTATGTMIGTPLYMSPEQCKGVPTDRRADIYSLGLIMYEALAGRKAFNVSGLYEIMHAHMNVMPPEFASFGVSVPPALESLIRKAIAKEPDARFAGAEQILQALEELQAGAASGTMRAVPVENQSARLRSMAVTSLPPSEQPPARAGGGVIAAGAVLLLAAIGFGAWTTMSARHSAAPVKQAAEPAVTAAPQPAAPATSAPSKQAPAAVASTTSKAPPENSQLSALQLKIKELEDQQKQIKLKEQTAELLRDVQPERAVVPAVRTAAAPATRSAAPAAAPVTVAPAAYAVPPSTASQYAQPQQRGVQSYSPATSVRYAQQPQQPEQQQPPPQQPPPQRSNQRPNGYPPAGGGYGGYPPPGPNGGFPPPPGPNGGYPPPPGPNGGFPMGGPNGMPPPPFGDGR